MHERGDKWQSLYQFRVDLLLDGNSQLVTRLIEVACTGDPLRDRRQRMWWNGSQREVERKNSDQRGEVACNSGCGLPRSWEFLRILVLRNGEHRIEGGATRAAIWRELYQV